LKQPQRANVAMSRAKELLIVAGSATLLGEDPLWRQYLERMMEFEGVCWDLSKSHPEPLSAAALQRLPYAATTQVGELLTLDTVTSALEERPFERFH
jgi:hypothetical protein